MYLYKQLISDRMYVNKIQDSSNNIFCKYLENCKKLINYYIYNYYIIFSLKVNNYCHSSLNDIIL